MQGMQNGAQGETSNAALDHWPNGGGALYTRM